MSPSPIAPFSLKPVFEQSPLLKKIHIKGFDKVNTNQQCDDLDYQSVPEPSDSTPSSVKHAHLNFNNNKLSFAKVKPEQPSMAPYKDDDNQREDKPQISYRLVCRKVHSTCNNEND